MPTITKTQRDANVNQGSTPYGNLTALRYVLETNASGAVIGSDSTAAVALGDIVRIGPLPAGLRFVDSEVIVSTGMSASVTGSLGFAYTDGVDSAAVPQSANHFGAALNLASAARLRNATSNATVTLPKQAWLTLTTAGANNAKSSRIEVVIFAIVEGNA